MAQVRIRILLGLPSLHRTVVGTNINSAFTHDRLLQPQSLHRVANQRWLVQFVCSRWKGWQSEKEAVMLGIIESRLVGALLKQQHRWGAEPCKILNTWQMSVKSSCPCSVSQDFYVRWLHFPLEHLKSSVRWLHRFQYCAGWLEANLSACENWNLWRFCSNVLPVRGVWWNTKNSIFSGWRLAPRSWEMLIRFVRLHLFSWQCQCN